MPSPKRTTALVAFATVLTGTVGLNAILGMSPRSLRIDCTQERLYTPSAGVKQLVGTLDEPLKLDLYWSASVGNDVSQFQTYAQRVREFLDEIATHSNGMLRVRMIDPEPSSEAEDEARAAGLAALAVDGAGRTLTLGLVLRSSTDKTEVIPYLDPAQESLLEYEVARRIIALRGGKKPVVAVLSSIPMQGTFDPRNPQRAPSAPVVIQQMEQLFDVRQIDPATPSIPEDANVLMVIQPKGFSEDALKAIDQWIVRGKPTLACLDPWCESDPSTRQMGMAGGASGSSFDATSITTLLGIDIPIDAVVGDRANATRVQARTQTGAMMELNYLPWLSLRRDALTATDPVVGALASLNLMSVGSIKAKEGATTKLEPVVVSSSDVQMIPTMKLGFFGQPDQLLRDFVSTNTQHTLAARVTGSVTSAYPTTKDDGSTGEPATGSANVIVIADADFLQDQTWVTEERFAGQLLGYRAMADNGSLVLNAVENLAGDKVLASLRGRGEFRRPFNRVERLRQEAEAKYLAEEQSLEESIQQSQRRISELQREKGTGQNALILSPEQEAELDKLEATMADARKKLRDVQYRLRQDIDWLGSGLMLANVALWPAVVAIGAAGWTARRMMRQRRSGGSR